MFIVWYELGHEHMSGHASKSGWNLIFVLLISGNIGVVFFRLTKQYLIYSASLPLATFVCGPKKKLSTREKIRLLKLKVHVTGDTKAIDTLKFCSNTDTVKFGIIPLLVSVTTFTVNLLM